MLRRLSAVIWKILLSYNSLLALKMNGKNKQKNLVLLLSLVVIWHSSEELKEKCRNQPDRKVLLTIVTNMLKFFWQIWNKWKDVIIARFLSWHHFWRRFFCVSSSFQNRFVIIHHERFSFLFLIQMQIEFPFEERTTQEFCN